MKPEKVQATTSSSDASLNFTCKNEKDFSDLYACSISSISDASKEKKVSNLSKETTSASRQVIRRYNETSNNDREVIDDSGVSRADEEQSNSIQKKLCLIKCKNNENEVVNENSSEKNFPLVLIESNLKSSKLISLKKNGSTLVFQKKQNESSDTAIKDSLKSWQSNLTGNSNNSKSHQWSVSDFYSSDIQNSNSDIDVNEDKNLKLGNTPHYNKKDFDKLEFNDASDKIKMKSTAEQSNVSRRWRIEEFLKNLVGKKASSLTTNQSRKRTPSLEQDIMENQSLMKISMKPDLSSSMVSLNKERMPYKSTTSLNSMSLSIVNQKLWSVLPLLNRKDGSSCNNLLLTKDNENKFERINNKRFNDNTSIVNAKKQSKSSHNLLEPIKPLNRLRNSKSCYIADSCSRCSSLFSLSALGSNASLNFSNGAYNSKNTQNKFHSSSLDYDRLDGGSNELLLNNDMIQVELLDENNKKTQVEGHLKNLTCKLCLSDCTEDQITKIELCGCFFCIECMKAYVEFEIVEGAYELSCPDALCSLQGIVSFEEITKLASPSLVAKHHRYRLNREVELDKSRVWCPNRNCETICSIGPTDKLQQPSSSNLSFVVPRAVLCLTCKLEFCSNCKKEWHPSMSCEENGKKLGGRQDSIMLFDNDLIKCCPMCSVPIEKDEGCAQMMCKRCKHVFCWYCLSSLDDDFLLRHYDKGPCKNKLGHSRASVVWHRAQVIGIFAGFGILLLAASPLLLLAAPCIVCCKCKIEESSSTSKVLDNVQLEEL